MSLPNGSGVPLTQRSQSVVKDQAMIMLVKDQGLIIESSLRALVVTSQRGLHLLGNVLGEQLLNLFTRRLGFPI